MTALPPKRLLFVPFVLLAFAASSAHAAAPPAMEPPDAALERTIQEKSGELAAALASLREAKTPDDRLVDVEVFHKAAVWVTAQQEWYKDYAKWTPLVLDRGLKRAARLKAGDAPWLHQRGHVVRAYRSAIDGSVQPYAVILPKDYPGDGKKWRLDLILHGRDDTLAEVKFIHQSDTDAAAPDQPYVELHVYGRGNNGYRWAGERDAFEALDAFTATEHKTYGRYTIDDERIVLRGFSMGGAGAWHLGLHYPSSWCSCSPGAGFTSTFGLAKEKPGPLPDYIAKCIASYDAVDYAENVFDVPTVAYGGEIDPQLQASQEIEAVVKPMGLPATFLVGPGMAHKYHPDSLKEIMRLQGEHAERGRPAYPPEVRFVTRTPRYGHCFWIDVVCQQRQYDRSFVDAHWTNDAGYQVTTENVQSLLLWMPIDWVERKVVPIKIDGSSITATPVQQAFNHSLVLLDRETGAWAQADNSGFRDDILHGKRKTYGLTGPIDDAFTGPFLCVRGTGKAWNAVASRYIDADLARFGQEWSKWMRGQLPVKDDTAVTNDDLQHDNLILFGDPSSNSLIARALPHLPLKWTKDELSLGGETLAAANHVPVLVYPSPFTTGLPRYVVLNSGHTFHTPQFKDTNRMLYPRLGDFAALKVGISESDPTAMEAIKAGLFDEQWRAPGR